MWKSWGWKYGYGFNKYIDVQCVSLFYGNTNNVLHLPFDSVNPEKVHWSHSKYFFKYILSHLLSLLLLLSLRLRHDTITDSEWKLHYFSLSLSFSPTSKSSCDYSMCSYTQMHMAGYTMFLLHTGTVQTHKHAFYDCH